MMMNDLHIIQFKSILQAKDKKGHAITMRARYANCFIITLKGKIRFSFDGFSIITSDKQGIFIPKGIAYKNECLEDAESIVVNFETAQKDLRPCPLQPLDANSALRFYHNMNGFVSENGTDTQYYLLSELYLMAYQLFRSDIQKDHKDLIAEKAISFIHNALARPTLQINDIAKHCNISSVYLRKILKDKYHKTPFEILTDARMKRADILLLEGRQVKEVAMSVGYSDVYQFSRAFKRYHGFPPSAKIK